MGKLDRFRLESMNYFKTGSSKQGSGAGRYGSFAT